MRDLICPFKDDITQVHNIYYLPWTLAHMDLSFGHQGQIKEKHRQAFDGMEQESENFYKAL